MPPSAYFVPVPCNARPLLLSLSLEWECRLGIAHALAEAYLLGVLHSRHACPFFDNSRLHDSGAQISVMRNLFYAAL